VSTGYMRGIFSSVIVGFSLGISLVIVWRSWHGILVWAMDMGILYGGMELLRLYRRVQGCVGK
jgi:hypothetical protein